MNPVPRWARPWVKQYRRQEAEVRRKKSNSKEAYSEFSVLAPDDLDPMREQSIAARKFTCPIHLETLTRFWNSSFEGRVALIGIGNRLYGDDGAGLELLRRLKDGWEAQGPCSKSEEKRFFIDAGESPEDWFIQIVDLKPDVIVVIDAVDLQAEPGSVAVLASEALPETFCCSTHRLPLRSLLELWEKSGSTTLVLAIQPKELTFREGLSPEVKMSVDLLGQLFSERLSHTLFWEATSASRLREDMLFGKANAAVPPHGDGELDP